MTRQDLEAMDVPDAPSALELEMFLNDVLDFEPSYPDEVQKLKTWAKDLLERL